MPILPRTRAAGSEPPIGSCPVRAESFIIRFAARARSPAWLALGAMVVLSGCQRGAQEPVPEIRPVRAVTIEKRDSNGTVALTGTVQAQTEINLSFRIDGRLIERTVDVGDTVKRGQLIARLDPQNEESALQSVRAQLAAADAQLVEARSNFNRMSELVVEDAVSRAQFEQAKALLQSAEAQVQSVRGQLNLAQNRLSYTRLTSDVAGVVTARGGPEITVSLASAPKVTAKGRVREVAPRADPVTGTFAVRVRLIDPPPAMRLGSTVTGRITLEGTSGIAIPATALMRSGGKTAVWVFDPKAGTVALRDIAVRAADTATVQVASGLDPGDVVVTAGVQALRPGQKVRLLESKP